MKLESQSNRTLKIYMNLIGMKILGVYLAIVSTYSYIMQFQESFALKEVYGGNLEYFRVLSCIIHKAFKMTK